MRKPSPALLALGASALAALSAGRAQAQPDGNDTQVDYRYSAYREDALPQDRVVAGTGERYAVDTHQFRLVQTAGETTTLSADLTLETMSGASPRFVQPDADGNPVQVMSGASIEDKRGDLQVSMKRAKAGRSATLSLGYSGEEDYSAINGAVEGGFELDDRMTTLSFGLGYSDDTIDPSQGMTPTGTLHDKRSAATVYGSYARVLDAVTAVQTTVSFTAHDGYLGDPYKEAWIVNAANTVPDARPDGRQQVSWLTRLRRFFKGADAALHADYRYYHDDWEVDAHTVDLAWHQNFGAMLRVAPGVRWYSQSQAFFYEPFYNAPRSDGFASSDYRLSPYGAVSANLSATWDFDGWNAGLRYERYESSPDYALGKVAVENPGLVDFDVASLSVQARF
ncbi:MAG TPA: DUF3570 domain-containing protein [Verrucomicrobiae bacterium]|nr:DUF3570 domain-containing protein [Verrucomicrobiae bacterium]